jgi:hypothetical protein
MLALKEDADPASFDFNLAQRREIARRLKTAFADCLAWAAKDMRDTVEFRHVAKTIPLTRRMVTEDEYRKNSQWATDLRQTDNPTSLRRLRRCEDVVKKFEEQQDIPAFSVRFHVVRLGDIALVTNPFELFLDFGLRVQARSPAVQTFVIQLAGNRAALEQGVADPGRFPLRGGTYLPTARAESGGGYGACVYCNQVGHQGGQEWVEAVLREFGKLFPSESAIDAQG